jgi:hypothetical protein
MSREAGHWFLTNQQVTCQFSDSVLAATTSAWLYRAIICCHPPLGSDQDDDGCPGKRNQRLQIQAVRVVSGKHSQMKLCNQVDAMPKVKPETMVPPPP